LKENEELKEKVEEKEFEIENLKMMITELEKEKELL